MNLQEILDQVNFRLNKEQSGNTMTPLQYNNNLQLVNILFFNWKYGLPQEYQPGSYMSRQAWEQTQQITDDLSSLLVLRDGVENALLLLDSNGVAVLPDDYLHMSSCAYMWYRNSKICNVEPYLDVRPVTPLFDSEVDTTLSNANRKPDLMYPVCRIYGRKIRVWPALGIDRVKFNYLRKPRKPVYGYDIENDIPVYNPLTSVELEWPETTHPDIINLIVDLASDNLRESFNKNAAAQRKREGI